MANKDKKSWQNNKSKSDKPHDTCFTLSQDQKFFVPADCDENVFQIICTLVKAQINKAKQSGGNGKEINEISKDTLVNLLKHFKWNVWCGTVSSSGGGKIWNFISFGFQQLTNTRIWPQYILEDTWSGERGVLHQPRQDQRHDIQNWYWWLCIFMLVWHRCQSQLHECRNLYSLSLLHSVSDTNTQVNTASGQDMGVIGHVMVTFKLGKQVLLTNSWFVGFSQDHLF